MNGKQEQTTYQSVAQNAKGMIGTRKRWTKMTKGLITLSVDTEVITLIKALEFKSLSNYVEQLFRVELNLKTDDKSNEVGELKIMNAKMNAKLEQQKIEIDSLKKQLDVKQPKGDEEGWEIHTIKD